MREPFQTAREDGRSDKRVVYELVEDAEPETMFTYEDLQIALEEGMNGTEIGRDRIYRAIAQANRLFLREKRRFLAVVKGVGYRVTRADENVPYALIRKGRAEQQLAAGVDLLRHVRYEELNDAERQLAEGTLLVFDGFYRAIRSSESRHERQEETINALAQRLEKLEATT